MGHSNLLAYRWVSSNLEHGPLGAHACLAPTISTIGSWASPLSLKSERSVLLLRVYYTQCTTGPRPIYASLSNAEPRDDPDPSPACASLFVWLLLVVSLSLSI